LLKPNPSSTWTPAALAAILAAILAAGLSLAACGPPAFNSAGPLPPEPTADVGSGALHGAGATFPAPFYGKAISVYGSRHPRVTAAYDAVGSGTGIQRFTQQAVDFGASDVPMTATEVEAAGGESALVEFPSTVGVVGIAYNLPGLDNLKLDGPTLADIFLGKIKRWDEPGIKRLNPDANLPPRGITVAHRADGSGTTFAVTDYLSKVSDEWRSAVGAGKAVKWPVGVGAEGNPGEAKQVQATAGAIGYVELAYVVQAGLQVALLRNRGGSWVEPTPAGGTAAAAALIGVSPTNFSITDGDGTDVYPISTLSWVLMRRAQPDPARARALVYLWRWMITDGQRYATDLQYAPLPTDVQNFALVQLTKVTANGQPIMPYLGAA
jgi:phosphate transport system substrate-binding protein